MALSAVTKIMRDGKITLLDGAGTANDLVVSYEEGTLSMSGLSGDQAEILKFFDRGTFYSARKGKDTFPSGSFTCHMTEISDATNEVIYDFIMKTNAFSANVSTLGANAEVYAIKLQWDVEGSDHGDGTDHQLTFDDCICTIDFAEGEPNVWTINLECLGAITAT